MIIAKEGAAVIAAQTELIRVVWVKLIEQRVLVYARQVRDWVTELDWWRAGEIDTRLGNRYNIRRPTIDLIKVFLEHVEAVDNSDTSSATPTPSRW